MSAPAIPCGLVAKSVFNDTYVLKKDGKTIPIVETGIAWSSDIQYKFKNIENEPNGKPWQEIQWLDMTDGKIIIYNLFILILYFSDRTFHRLDENCRSTKLQKALG